MKIAYKDKNIVFKVSKRPPGYYLWVRPAANLLPVTDDGKMLVMHEYKTFSKRWIWGFPGGMIEPGETAAHAANRECQEELGLKARRTKKIIEVKTEFPESSVTYFLGFGLRKSESKGWEKIGQVKKVSLHQLVTLATSGVIQDPRMVVAVLQLNALVRGRKLSLTA